MAGSGPLDLPTAGDVRQVGAQKLLAALAAIQIALAEAVTIAQGTGAGGVNPSPSPNQAPTAQITVGSQSNLSVALSAASSADPDGAITSYRWSFGDGTTATGVYATHAYSAAGKYTVTLTITDDDGATDTVSTAVTVTAPVAQSPYTQDSGLGTNNGTQVAGPAYTPLNTAGVDVGAQANTAGASNQLSLPVGTVQKLKGWNGSTVIQAATLTSSGGIIGAGSAKSILSQVPNSSSGTTYVNGTTRNELIRSATPGAVFQDFQLLGTSQSVVNHHGFQVTAATTFKRLILRRAGVGSDKAPPGETFGISAYNFKGGLYVEDVEIDGQGAGASGFATNGGGTASGDGRGIGDYTVNRLYAHDNWYSGAIALWQQSGTATFNDCTFDRCRCFWNIERCAGQVVLNRPRIGALKAATTGWDNGVASPVHIFAEAGTGWTTQAEALAFRFIVNDPRNLDGTPYTGPRITITLGSATGGTNFYTKANTFRAYSASGADISSTFYA